MNKAAFLAALRAELVARNAWAVQNPAKLESFMASTETTLNTDRNTVTIDSDSFKAAWKTIGGKGKPTYKGLRALPAGPEKPEDVFNDTKPCTKCGTPTVIVDIFPLGLCPACYARKMANVPVEDIPAPNFPACIRKL
jgi:hypothetical protein